MNKFKIGDKVIKNPENWVPSDFDGWGRGKGTGIIIPPPFDLDDGQYYVKWKNGRCFEDDSQLLPWVDPDPIGTLINSRVFNYYFSEGDEVMLDITVMDEEQLKIFKDYIGKKAIVIRSWSDLHAFGLGYSYIHEVSFDGVPFIQLGFNEYTFSPNNISTYMLIPYKDE